MSVFQLMTIGIVCFSIFLGTFIPTEVKANLPPDQQGLPEGDLGGGSR